jgi:mannose-6-phosphate isomerase
MANNMKIKEPLLLDPHYRDYMWGGQRLRPWMAGPTAEAWVIYSEDIILNGDMAGQSLAWAAHEWGESLLGRQAVQQTGLRFPLLIKLLDCAAWLSLQVHPNDEQAAYLEGDGYFGKMEAWYFIETQPGAEILAGLKDPIDSSTFETAIRGGTLLDWMVRHPVHKDESILIKPGMIHALGPGMFVYEVQQTSDITYRVWDWGRPRSLHIDQTLAVTDLKARGERISLPKLQDGEMSRLLECQYFSLESGSATKKPIQLNTRGDSFDALTLLSGVARLIGDGWAMELKGFQSVVIPAVVGAYQIEPIKDPIRILRSRTVA